MRTRFGTTVRSWTLELRDQLSSRCLIETKRIPTEIYKYITKTLSYTIFRLNLVAPLVCIKNKTISKGNLLIRYLDF